MRSSSALLSAREGISDRLEARAACSTAREMKRRPLAFGALLLLSACGSTPTLYRSGVPRLARNRQKLRPVPFRRARVPRLRTSAAQRPRRGFGRAAAATLRPRLLAVHVRQGPQDSRKQGLCGFQRIGTVGGSHRATTAAAGTAAGGIAARLSGEVIFRFAPTCAS